MSQVRSCHVCHGFARNIGNRQHEFKAIIRCLQDKADAQHVSHMAKRASTAHGGGGDVFEMLSDALSGRHPADRASTAPCRASSTAGPFKVNSMKMNDEEVTLVDPNPVRERHPRRMSKTASYNARGGQNYAPILLSNALSLPIDHGLHGPGGPRQGRFTLEGVKEEQPSSFQSAYPQNNSTPEASAPAATPPAAESPRPRRWSLLRIFSMQKKDGTPLPAAAPNGASTSEVVRFSTGAAREPGGQAEVGGPRPSIDSRLATTLTRRAPQSYDDRRRPSYGPRDAMPSSQFGIQTRGTYVPSAQPGTASSTGTLWQTPQAELHTPSTYITPVPLNPPRRVPAERSKEILQAAQKATPEQARAMLQKFGSIRAQQRRNSQVTGY